MDNNNEIVALRSNSTETDDFKSELFDWISVIITSLIVIVFLFSFVFKIVTIYGKSMEDTFHGDERVIISNVCYTPKRLDVVVISRDLNNSGSVSEKNRPIIKRIIATAGQTVDIDFESGIVYVDGVALDEPYTKTPTNLNYDIKFPVYVPDGCVFVLGDNRNDSLDSRSSTIGEYGMIDERYILGKVVFRILPFNKFGGIK